MFLRRLDVEFQDRIALPLSMTNPYLNEKSLSKNV